VNEAATIAITAAAAAAVDGDTTIARGQARLTDPIPHADPLAAALLQAAEMLIAHLTPAERDRTGLVLATLHGCLATDWTFDRSRRDEPRFASPAAFSRTLPSTLAAEAALRLTLRGPSVVLTPANHASAALALHRAAAWMHAFSLTHCITGAFDLEENRARVALVLLETGHPDNHLASLQLSHSPADKEFTLPDLLAWIRCPTPVFAPRAGITHP
jgi:hypothetical protein